MDPAQLFEAELLACNRIMHEATQSGDSEVQKFYDGTTVFVTGGSGFLGKQLIEKLLRATNVSKIFIIMRSKKERLIQERFEEMLKDPVYDFIREHQPKFEQKLVPIAGDVAELRLGMSDTDWKIVTEQTDVIFHLAATTRFDEVLRVATLVNVRGTREVLELATECRQLRSFVHVSTAYSCATSDRIDNDILEVFYNSPVDPEALIKLAETVEETRLNDMKPGFIKGWPNTYTFTKAVSEELVRKRSKQLPICILRPAIVICTLREPTPGWLDMSCVYGATGLVLGGALGVIHIFYIDNDKESGLIPVDYVNNAAIVAGWDTSKRGDEKRCEEGVKIYNIISSNRNPILWGTIHDLFISLTSKYSLPDCILYVFFVFTKNPFLVFVFNLIFHMIPACIIDGILFLLGKKVIAVKLAKKITTMLKVLSYFTTNEWNFKDTNVVELYEKLSPVDKEIFEFDVMKIDWNKYIKTWCMGMRKYIVKDGLTGTEYGRKKQTIFKILSLFVIGPLYFYMLYKVLFLVFLGILYIF